MNIKSNLQSSISDQRSRVFLFLMIAVIVIISVFYYVTFSTTATPAQAAGRPTVTSKVDDPTSGVKSIPGTGKTTTKYKQLEEKYEQQQLEQAIKKAEGGQPTAIISALDFSDVPEFKESSQYGDQLQQKYDQRQTAEEQRKRERELKVVREELDKQNRQIMKMLGAQAEVLANNWQVSRLEAVSRTGKFEGGQASPMLVYLRDKAQAAEKEQSKPSIYYKAGDILFGVILTSVNSDQPGPVLGRILSGPLSNSKIVGTIGKSSLPKDGTDPQVSQALVLEFNLMNIPGMTRSLPVKAVAIDPETARTSLATSVDNHYVLRYGTFFASEFLAGLGKAISQQSATTVVTGNGTADIGRTDRLSGTDEAKIAVGSTAEALSSSLNFLKRPPTIEIAAGTAVGILLQQDLVISGEQANTQELISNTPQVANSLSTSNITTGFAGTDGTNLGTNINNNQIAGQ